MPQDGGTPLHVASQNGHVAIAQKLLEANAAVDLQMEVLFFSITVECTLCTAYYAHSVSIIYVHAAQEHIDNLCM